MQFIFDPGFKTFLMFLLEKYEPADFGKVGLYICRPKLKLYQSEIIFWKTECRDKNYYK